MLSLPWFMSRTACHILECSDGLAQGVISTIGQAFELQFKQYLHSPPKTLASVERWEAAESHTPFISWFQMSSFLFTSNSSTNVRQMDTDELQMHHMWSDWNCMKPKYPILTSGLFIFIQVWGKLSMHIFIFVGLSGQKSLFGGRMRVSLITITTTAYQARSLPLGELWTPGSEGMELCWVTSTASCRATPPHRWLSRQSVNCELWPYLIIVTWSVCMRAASPTAFRRVMDSASYSAKHVWPLADNQIHVELCVMT